MTKTRAAGLDNGHGGTKLFTDAFKEGLVLPTVISITETSISNDMEELEDFTFEELVENLKVTFVSTKALESTNVTYYVGLSSVRSGGASQETPLMSFKYRIEHPIVCGLSALALDAIKANPNKKKININYDLAAALPVTSMEEGKLIQEARFTGIHELIVHQRSGNDIHVTINVEFCQVIPESVAASFGVCYDEKGKAITRTIYNPETESEAVMPLKDVPLLHVDIGGGTTELVTSIGVKYQREKSTSVELGSKKPINILVGEWDKKFPRKPLKTVANFNYHYFNPNARFHVELQNFAKQTLNGEARLIAQEIINHYNMYLLTEEQLYFIAIYGGSSVLFKSELAEVLKQNNLSDYTFFVENPMFANARGLYVYVNSPIYTNKKKKVLATVEAN